MTLSVNKSTSIRADDIVAILPAKGDRDHKAALFLADNRILYSPISPASLHRKLSAHVCRARSVAAM